MSDSLTTTRAHVAILVASILLALGLVGCSNEDPTGISLDALASMPEASIRFPGAVANTPHTNAYSWIGGHASLHHNEGTNASFAEVTAYFDAMLGSLGWTRVIAGDIDSSWRKPSLFFAVALSDVPVREKSDPFYRLQTVYVVAFATDPSPVPTPFPTGVNK